MCALSVTGLACRQGAERILVRVAAANGATGRSLRRLPGRGAGEQRFGEQYECKHEYDSAAR